MLKIVVRTWFEFHDFDCKKKLLWRTAIFNNYQQSGFMWLFKVLKARNYNLDKFWILLENEFHEAKSSASWEEAGREFRLFVRPITYRIIKDNLPFYVFFNGNQGKGLKFYSLNSKKLE